MDLIITPGNAPAPGDVRQAGEGDRLLIERPMRERPEWCRYVDAVRHAVGRGADVQWVRRAS
ncbi:hypothetical protein SEA_EURATIS_30 [Streptomyces phage Euratis]|uniref:Uncharacterized protein n=1 Tax=Streptomyces phage Euratis TaxID=2510569 RepID=A0A411B0Z8_9CAUD|nr:hypothetical protein SEA_EURATIS_30 [Streptomyces phage Euratis]